MEEAQLHAAPRVTAAIAAVKEGVAQHYRALASSLPDAAARTRWQESHGALRIIGHSGLIRLSEEIGNLLAYACDAAVDPAPIVAAINEAGAAILAFMDDLAANEPDRPMRLLPAYRAMMRARGIEVLPDSGLFGSDDGTPPTKEAPPITESFAQEMKRLNQAWSAWSAGETGADVLYAVLDAVERATGVLGVDAPAALLTDLRAAMCAQAAGGKSDPHAAVEICSALLMLEDFIEDAPRAAASFARRAGNARARLQACQHDHAALQRLPPMEVRDVQARSDESKVLVSQTLAQADNAIRHAVSVLEAFFADAKARRELAALDKPLAQCVGMFTMLQDDSAAAATRLCREEIGQLAAGPENDATIKDPLARRLTVLMDYVDASRRNNADLDALLARAGLTIPGPNPTKNTVGPEAANIENGAEALDKDMLEVFLEEAVEVLATIETTLPISEQDSDNAEHLTTLRRAFHTLKGSGRMVGLIQLGEAAWEIEQVFNKLAQDALPATPDLFRLVVVAHESFTHWITELRASGHTRVDGKMLIDWARCVHAGESLPAAGRAPLNELPPDKLTDIVDMQTVTIGATRLSAVLYRIFIDEARQHTAVLQNYGARIVNEPAVAADPAFLRAAHTLCGISATVGFDMLSELASGLERTLLRAEKPGDTLGPAARFHAARAVECLSHMVKRLAQREAPEAEPELIEALNQSAITGNVDAISAPPLAVVVAQIAEAPTAERTPLTERRATRLDDDIDTDLLEIFLAETEELLPRIEENLRDWRTQSDDKLVPQSLQRLLHTLKGNARMAGAMAVGELTHQMETRVENACRLPAVPESLHDELDASYDRLNELIDALRRLELGPGSGSQTFPGVDGLSSQTMPAVTLTGGLRPVTATITPVRMDVPTEATPPALATSGSLLTVTDATFPAPIKAAAAQRAVLRLRADSAERLANQAGEVAIARARAESELRGARAVMRELTDNVVRLRGQLREIEIQAELQMQSRIAQAEEADGRFDPLEFDRFTRLQELTRLMAESVNDVATVQQNLIRNLDEGEAALGAQARTTRELQDDLVRIRMAPFSSLSDRLYRVARLASRDVAKRVQLDIRGAQAELDRGVLDRIVAPLEHLLRNSIAHGIEPENARVAAGKPEVGEIVIEVRQEGNEVVLGIADDGAGLDIARIRAKAVAKDMMREDEVLSEAQIADFIFCSGFSTAESVSEIAGRGVGLDVVRNEISNLGGRIEMDFQRGKGTRFTIYLSLTLAVMKAVVIRTGEELYALPSLLVEQVQSLKPDALGAAYSARKIVWREQRYPLHYAAHLLGRAHTAPSQQRYSPVLLLRSGPHRAAIHVDQLLGSQEIIAKNIGPQLARVAGITGAAVLAGGDTVLILNPVQLAQRPAPAAVHPDTQATAAPEATPAALGAGAALNSSAPVALRPAASPVRQTTVLVVDDSLTVRKITSRTLTREGYNVVVAKDGIEALEKMQARAPDVIVTDIEMPRMDGFDLTRNVRADPLLKNLPVIMITSRTADKHRQHAAELGVTVFLGKPYEERELLENIAGVAHASV